jgi:predicted dehydrogenase
MERLRIHALSRREFLQESALASALGWSLFAGSRAAAEPAPVEPLVQNEEPLRIGIIGPGSQGIFDLSKAIRVPGVQCVAACDVLDVHLKRVQQVAQIPDNSLYTDYRRLLDRKDIQAVLITTPLVLHAPMTIDALNAGKHVFVEKQMAYTIEEAKEMARTAQRVKKVLQVGHHRASSIGYNHAYEMIAKKKVCGRITHIRAQWNRNGDWRRKIPQGAQIVGGKEFWGDLEHLINWRLYKRSSHGLMAELGGHQVHVTNWFLNAPPVAVMGVGGIDYWKDGRDIWDNVQCIYEYPDGVKLTYQSLTTNQFDGFQEQFMGDKGTLITTLGDKNMDKGFLYQEPKADTLEWAQFAAKEKGAGGKTGLVLNAAATKKLSTGAKIGETTLATTGADKDAYDLQFYNWAASIREGKRIFCDALEGLRCTVAIVKANEAMEKQTRIEITPDMYTI